MRGSLARMALSTAIRATSRCAAEAGVRGRIQRIVTEAGIKVE